MAKTEDDVSAMTDEALAKALAEIGREMGKRGARVCEQGFAALKLLDEENYDEFMLNAVEFYDAE